MKNGSPVPLVEGAEALRGFEYGGRAWPYKWELPPYDSQNVNVSKAVVAPANGTLTELLSYTVPDGYQFRLRYILLTYTGTAFVDGTSQVTWNVDVDIPVPPGGSVTIPIIPSGYRIPDFASINWHLGSLENGPWPVPGRMVFMPQKVLRVKATTVAPFPAGATVRFLSMFVGWLYPDDRVEF